MLSEFPLDDQVVWRFFSDSRRPAWGDLRAHDREIEIGNLERRLRRELHAYRREMLEHSFIGVAVVVMLIFAYQLGHQRSQDVVAPPPVVNTTSVPVFDVGEWMYTMYDERLSMMLGGTWWPTTSTDEDEARFTVGPQNNDDTIRLRSSAGSVAELASAEEVAVERIQEALPGAMVNDRRSTTLLDGSVAVVARMTSSDADASSRRLDVVAATETSLVEMVFASDSANRYESLESGVEERLPRHHRRVAAS